MQVYTMTRKNSKKYLHSTISYKYKIVLEKFFYAGSQIRAMQIRAMRNRASRGMTVIIWIRTHSKKIKNSLYWITKVLIFFCFFLSQVPSARLCRRLCDENPNCNFFTWYSLTDSQTAQSGGDVFGHICFHHQDCAQLDFKCKNCHSGPRSDNCHNRRHRTSSGRK